MQRTLCSLQLGNFYRPDDGFDCWQMPTINCACPIVVLLDGHNISANPATWWTLFYCRKQAKNLVFKSVSENPCERSAAFNNLCGLLLKKHCHVIETMMMMCWNLWIAVRLWRSDAPQHAYKTFWHRNWYKVNQRVHQLLGLGKTSAMLFMPQYIGKQFSSRLLA